MLLRLCHLFSTQSQVTLERDNSVPHCSACSAGCSCAGAGAAGAADAPEHLLTEELIYL